MNTTSSAIGMSAFSATWSVFKTGLVPKCEKRMIPLTVSDLGL